MSYPDFLIAGVQRAGTTWLYRILTEHPGVAGASKKEINFFDNPRLWQQGAEWYEQFFSDRSGLTGEATPGYTFSSRAAERISGFNPEVKIIVCLREPASRAYSAYWLFRDREFKGKTFAQSVESDAGGIFSRGLYADQLERLFRYIPRSQVMVIFYEEMKAKNLETAQNMFKFLNLDSSFVPLDMDANYNAVLYPRLQNALAGFGLQGAVDWFKRTRAGDMVRQRAFRRGSNYPAPDTDTMQALREQYAPHNARLFAMLNETPRWQALEFAGSIGLAYKRG